MSAQSQPQNAPAPSEKDAQYIQDRGLFDHHEAQKHEKHHYLRMYGGQVVNAAMWGFGATLGADAANAAVGEMKVCAWLEDMSTADYAVRNGGDIELVLLRHGATQCNERTKH
ncbi:hypothetical protein AMS68_007257 [Peltaster fructicola]|uniref:Uncharacterized protein n=1 Tax=Peltaster fructicola TaxID=286661 RepID=A0A6H0Y553_9PEZI|nr:hypothetical protein AMS68_007257 [Peltaster fructicola]